MSCLRGGMKKISKKQQARNKLWREITLLKWAELGRKCQWCGYYVVNPVGHHIRKRSMGRVDTPKNCYVCHELPCHNFIETQGVDVSIYKTKKLWEDRDDNTKV